MRFVILFPRMQQFIETGAQKNKQVKHINKKIVNEEKYGVMTLSQIWIKKVKSVYQYNR